MKSKELEYIAREAIKHTNMRAHTEKKGMENKEQREHRCPVGITSGSLIYV